jgi:hypothetical protein
VSGHSTNGHSEDKCTGVLASVKDTAESIDEGLLETVEFSEVKFNYS